MLFLQILQAILLPSILSDKVFHLCRLLNVIQLLFQGLCVLIDKDEELFSNSDDHVTNVIFPLGQVVLRLLVLQDGVLC